MEISPAPGADGVCVDTRLQITLARTAQRGHSGMVRVYDTANGQVIDSLDLAIPDGPTQPRTYGPECDYAHQAYDYSRTSMPTNRTVRPGTPSSPQAGDVDEGNYQLNIIGGFTDGFHFHPILTDGNIARICLHNNVLEYSKEYRIAIDPDAISGLDQPLEWTFTTKAEPQLADTIRVNADGSADFCTLQGALDAIPDFSAAPIAILVAPGDYQEIVYARNKTNLEIVGSGSDCTHVHYANNEVFNPHPLLIKTNEYPGTFPSRRAAVMFDNCHDLTLRDINFRTDLTGQAEGLLLNGERIALYGVHIEGSGDALQANGTIYMENCQLDGSTDAILSRGSIYAYRCDLRNDGGPFTWMRNTMGHHGGVFVECSFSSPKDGKGFTYGRTPTNHGSSYPHAEVAIIDCTVSNINPAGWSVIGEPTARMLEFNTIDADTGMKADTSERAPYSKQLDAVADAELLQCLRNPAFVLKGWHPRRSK